MTQSDINGSNRHKCILKSIINHSKLQIKIIYEKILLLLNLEQETTVSLG